MDGLYFLVTLLQGLLHVEVKLPFLLDALLLHIPDDAGVHCLGQLVYVRRAGMMIYRELDIGPQHWEGRSVSWSLGNAGGWWGDEREL